MIHVMGATSIAPAAFVALAEWSGSHEVQLQCSAGSMCIVLHHSSKDYTPLTSDHRDTLAKVLASCCTLDGHGDHVFEQQLAQANIASSPQAPVPAAAEIDTSASPYLAPPSATLLASAKRIIIAAAPPHQPHPSPPFHGAPSRDTIELLL
jgi:hypothetical protein